MANRTRVLIIDDEENLRSFLEEALAEEGFEVLTAGSGREALGILSQDRNLHIVFSDVRMPDGDGPWLLRALHAESLPIPNFYFISGHLDYPDSELISLGAKALLRKPFEIDDLIKIVRDLET